MTFRITFVPGENFSRETEVTQTCVRSLCAICVCVCRPSVYTPIEMWWHTLTHGRGSEGEAVEWSGKPVLFNLPRNTVYPALLRLIRIPRLPVFDWTDAPTGRFKWTRSLRWKTKFGFCACAITFQLASTNTPLLLYSSLCAFQNTDFAVACIVRFSY